MINFIKKNKELILVLLLIICVIIIKNTGIIKEGFESNVANSVSAIEQKFNQAFGIINATDVEILQNLNLKKNLNLDGTIVTKGNINSDGTIVAKGNIANGAVTISSNGTIYAKKLSLTDQIIETNIKIPSGKTICIGGTCINENHLKMLTQGFHLQGTVNGHGLNQFMHTHSSGHMATAAPQHRTLYKMFNRSV